MRYEMLRKIKWLNEEYKKRKRRDKAIAAAAGLVVFCTFYTLILPAIALENKAVCGIEEHRHSAECYTFMEVPTREAISCSLQLEQHIHMEDCFDEEGNLICGYGDYTAHTHNADCFDAEGNLWCELPEVVRHRHTQECYSSDSAELICGKPEILLHKHTKDCFNDSGEWICGKLEVTEHFHNEDCFYHGEEQERRSVLTCEKQEHMHGIDCYEPSNATVSNGTAGDAAGGADFYEATYSNATSGNAVVKIQPILRLTVEEWGQVSKVIRLLDKLPSMEEIGTKLAEFEDGENEEGYDAYLSAILQQAAEAYREYSALSDVQKEQIINVDRLMKLEWLWSAVTLDEIVSQLTDDSARVTEIAIDQCVTGTAPFDVNNEPGNDDGADNLVVRSFDSVTYNFTVTTAAYGNQSYSEARVKMEFVLPLSKEQATFDVAAMAWMDQTAGYAPVITDETREIDGQAVSCQVLTCYKHLLPSPGHTSVVPGQFGENVTIQVQMMNNGSTVEPIFSAALEHNTWDGECDTHHEEEKKSVKPEAVTVSAAPKYNVQIKKAFATEASSTFDFSSGNDMALNKTAGMVKGRIITYGITLQLYNDNASKQMKGVELPSGDITFDIKLKSSFTPQYANDKGEPQDVTETYTPLVWSYDQQSGSATKDGRNTSITSYSYAYGCSTPLNKRTSDWRRSCYDGGTWSAVQNGDTISFTVKDYKFDGIFPYIGVGDSEAASTYYNKDTGLRNVGCFSAAELYIVQPSYSESGTYILDDFSEDGTYGQDSRYCTDGTFTMEIQDVNLQAVSVTGQKLPAAADNSNQGNKTDDCISVPVELRRPGSYENRNLYSQGARMNDIFGRGEAEAGTCARDGNDWAVIGTNFYLTWGGYAKTNGDDANKMCAAKWLLKFDPEAIELLDKNLNSPAADYYVFHYSYAVKPDGEGWTGNSELKTTTMLELDYYSSIAEAEKHGAIVGVLVEAKPKNTVEEIPMGILTTYFSQKARVRTDPELANRVFIITEESMIWTLDDYQEAQKNGGIPSLTDSKEIKGWTFRENSPSTYQEKIYNEDGSTYQEHLGGYHYGDSLLVLSYQAQINKKLEQKRTDGDIKDTYEVGSGQRIADFLLEPSVIYGSSYEPEELTQKTTVTIKDTLPRYLTYKPGSSYFGGEYEQSSSAGGTQGIIHGGTLTEPDVKNNVDGTQTLTWIISDVTVGEKMPMIHYSTIIGKQGDQENDVPIGSTPLENTVQISAVGDARVHSLNNKNVAVAGLTVSRGSASSYGKYAKQELVERDGVIDYVIYYDNNSSMPVENIVLMDTMPVNGVNGSVFTGTYAITSWKLDAERCNVDDISLYYTTDEKYKNGTTQTVDKGTIMTEWTPAEIQSDGVSVSMNGEKPPVAWALIGKIAANSSANVAMRIQLIPEASDQGDSDETARYINMLSYGDNTVTTEVQSVRRTLEGLTWMDDNGDGIQNEASDRRISGVQVSLWKLIDGGDKDKEEDYVPYCYKETETPIVIKTGTQISVLAASSGEAEQYETGQYKFTDLPAGYFAVKFSDGSKEISLFLASPENRGENDVLDSDGIAVYKSDRSELIETRILGIELPAVEKMNVVLYESKWHDSGFYERGRELPQTGGSGTDWYMFSGLLLSAGAMVAGYIRRRRRERRVH